MVDWHYSTKFGVNSLIGFQEKVCYGRTTDVRVTSAIKSE